LQVVILTQNARSRQKALQKTEQEANCMNTFEFDLFVIGGGSGGVRAARMAAQHGAKVALAEAGGVHGSHGDDGGLTGAGLGGTCVNVGCIPKKLYSYAAHFAESFEESHGYGWEGVAPTLNWETLKTNRAKEISRLNGIYGNLLAGAGVTVILQRAKFVDAHTVEMADGTRHSAKHILIATGGHPNVPDIAGRELVVTSNEMFDLPTFPKRLLVVGGGYIACEFASIFNGLGAKVTQLYRGEQILRGFDDEVRDFAAGEMVKAGVDLRLQADVAAIERVAEGLKVTLHGDANENITVDTILYATGRVPNVNGLGLETLQIKQGKDGAIEVNANYQTSVPSIYALGDVTARVQLTPVALGEAMVLVDHLFGPPAGKAARSMSYQFIPTAVFTHPNIGTVGYSEVDARKEFGDITVFKSEFKALKHTLSGSTERTFMKLLVETTTDRVIGLHMVGPDAGEIVQGFAVAMKAGATKAMFDSTIGIHPTAAEEFVTMREPVIS
jgi:glutathione reductase (NADPH)